MNRKRIKACIRGRCLRLLRCLIFQQIKIYCAMAIKTRDELKLDFKNGNLPTERHFKDLIDSLLNRKDDNFFGQWQKGVKYCPGDVVLWKKSLFIAVDKNGEPKCQPVSDEASKKDESDCFCSSTSPDEDSFHWQSVELQMTDDDWQVVLGEPGKCDDIMYAKVWGKIGMGTSNPQARVEIKVANKGSFLFDPDGAEHEKNAPEFAIRDHTCPPGDTEPEVKQSVTPLEAYWKINVPGYAFRKLPEPHEGNETDPECPVHPELLMFITTDRREMPAVGIGTNAPDAAIDALEEGAGRILLRPGGNKNPELILVNLADGKETFFKISVERNATVFRNPAGKKFLFRQILEETGPLDECGREAPLLSIMLKKDEGNRLETMVGIGTENPQTQLEVTDGRSGRIHLSMVKPYPALAIVNTLSNDKENYMTLGVNNNHGLFVTDSPKGFEFRKGKVCGSNKNELDINQGTALMSITGEAKVGIGKFPQQCELDVQGEISSLGAYIPTDMQNIEETRPIRGKEALEKLKEIHPVRFKWKNSFWDGKGSDAWQMGLLGEEVGKQFEELVKNLDDGKQAVAYQNMVAVLVAAIKELANEVEELKRRLNG
jgi:hypothetical protein